MDLHQLDVNLWYFHITDEFSRYRNAVIINTKSSSIIANHFLKNWISLFGCPGQFFSENGGEFVSKHLIDLCENFNIKILTTPAESPWSNGLCERHVIKNKRGHILFIENCPSLGFKCEEFLKQCEWF